MNATLEYLWRGLLLTVRELVLLLGPALALGLALHYLAEAIRQASLRLMHFNLFAWLTAPGTVVHELGHAFFCLLFGHQVKELALFTPGKEESLGHVKHAYNPRNLYQMIGHFFIGSGPIWFGAVVLWGLSLLLLGGRLAPEETAAGLTLDDLPLALGRIVLSGGALFQRLLDPALYGHWPVYLFLYLAFSIGAHMTLSFPDLKGTLTGFAFLAGTLLVLNWAFLWVEGASARLCLMLLRPLGVVYAMMAFAILLTAILALLLSGIVSLAGVRERRE